MKTENETEGQPQVGSDAVLWPAWTHEPASQNAWYWWRHDENCLPIIVQVRACVGGEKEAWFPWGKTILLSGPTSAQWAGPIPLPLDCHNDLAHGTTGGGNQPKAH